MSTTNKLPRKLFLCGFMGAGKSTIGKELAVSFSVPFRDLDAAIVDRAGRDIPSIFNEEGEEAFRSYERSCLLEQVRHFEGVLALGGGSLQNQQIVDHLKINGLLIFIDTSISVILDRISKDTNRPLLVDERGRVKSEEILKKELTERYEKRLPYYRQAEITIQTEHYPSLEESVNALKKMIKQHVSNH